MPNLALDFVKPAPRYSMLVMTSLLSVLALTAIVLVLQQRQWAGEINEKNSQANLAGKTTMSAGAVQNEALGIKYAHQVQQALNQPWHSLLNALEQAQKDNNGIKLLSIQPKPERRQVLLGGQANEFDALMQYLESLRKQPGLGEVVLLNQHWEESAASEDSGQAEMLIFNLSAIWQP